VIRIPTVYRKSVVLLQTLLAKSSVLAHIQHVVRVDHRNEAVIQSSIFAFFIRELRSRKSKNVLSLCLRNYLSLPNPADDPAYFAALVI
jgi:hypothetical protein